MILGLGIAFITNNTTNGAKKVDFSVHVKNQTVKKSEEFTFEITVNSTIAMKKIEAYLKYDTNYLEFVSSEEKAVVGTSGILSINEEYEKACTNKVYEITMRALEVGTTKIEIEHTYVEDENNSDIIEITNTSANITIQTNFLKDQDANLESILVFPGELDQPFDSMITEYSVNVQNDVEEFMVSAQPNASDSIVTIEQPQKLKVGKNVFKINVESASGLTKTYTITVYREM